MNDFKPMLACDADLDNLDNLPYPMGAFIKYDGVRLLHRHGCYGRSLKLHANPYLQTVFDKERYYGFDSEGIVGDPEDPMCISRTSGAFSRKKDKPKEGKFVKVDAVAYVFDDFTRPELPFEERYASAKARVEALLAADPNEPLRMAEMFIVNCAADVLALEERFADHEGLILRSLKAPYKYGRATAKEAYYLRIKRFEEREFVITGFEEGSENTNEAKTNELGQTERSTKKEGMVPNGQIGAFLGYDVETKKDVKVAAGKLTIAEALEGFKRFDELYLSQTGKYKVFNKGTGNFSKPRFPTFQCLRSAEDMS